MPMTTLAILLLLTLPGLQGFGLPRPSPPPPQGRRKLLQATDAMCGPNDARRFDLIPRDSTADAAPSLARANADNTTRAIYIDRWVRSGRRTTQYLNIRSSLVLTKPLVIGTFIRIDIAAGVTLSLAAQPALPRREVFTGPGAVRFVPPQSVSGGAAAPAEFYAMPEWWRGSSDSDRLEALSAACSTFPGVQCRVVLTGAYKLIRPWRVTPSLLPWASPITSFEWVGPVGGGQGVLFAAGAYNPRRRLFLPRMFKFDDWAVKLEDVTGLDTYIHNMKYNVQGVVFAPRTAIRNTVVEVASAVGHVNVFTVAPLARGTLLENVYARSYINNKPPEGGQVVLTHFKGVAPPRLVNTTFENSEIVGGGETRNAQVFILKNDCADAVEGLVYRSPTWNGQIPNGWQVVSGKFNGLSATMRITKELYGSNSWRGANNTLDWWSLSRLSVDKEEAPQYTMAARPGQGGAKALTRNSANLMLPPLEGTWAAGTTRTFYAYHVMMGGSTDGLTMSLGPHNQARLPQSQRYDNPGIVVEALEDQGARTPFQLAVTLRNVGRRDLSQADFQGWALPLQFRLNVGLRQLN